MIDYNNQKYTDELKRILDETKQHRPSRIDFESLHRARMSLLSEAKDQIIDERRREDARLEEVGMYKNKKGSGDYYRDVGEEELFRRYRKLVEEHMIDPHKPKEMEHLRMCEISNFDPDGKKRLF